MSERIWGALRKNALYKSTYTLLHFTRLGSDPPSKMAFGCWTEEIFGYRCATVGRPSSCWAVVGWSVGRDRYPMRYGRNRTTTTVIAKVASVWIISVCVCLPLFVMGFVDRSTVYNDSTCVPAAKQVRLRAELSAKTTKLEEANTRSFVLLLTSCTDRNDNSTKATK